MRRSHHHPNTNRARRAGAPRWAMRVAALLAVFLQAFIVQTHVHAFSPFAGAAYARAANDAAPAVVENATAHQAAAACAMCQAQANNALTPATTALVLIGAPHRAQPLIEIRRVWVAAAHSWQSRAPPAHL